MKNKAFRTFESEFFSEDFVMRREYGDTPNGNQLNGRWVLRDQQGNFLDSDTYRYDLAERNNICLSDMDETTKTEAPHSIADRISCCAYQMFGSKPVPLISDWEPLQFEMYSYERITKLVIYGMAKEMLERGFTEDQVVFALQHKQVRFSLDANEDDLIDFGERISKSFVGE